MGTPEQEPNHLANERRHEVRITRSYLLGVHEVTRGQFRAFVNDSGYKTDAEKGGFALIWTGNEWQRRSGASWRDVGFEQTDNHPVLNMSWNDSGVATLRRRVEKSGDNSEPPLRGALRDWCMKTLAHPSLRVTLARGIF